MADECRRVETMAVEPSMQPVSRMQKVCLFFSNVLKEQQPRKENYRKQQGKCKLSNLRLHCCLAKLYKGHKWFTLAPSLTRRTLQGVR